MLSAVPSRDNVVVPSRSSEMACLCASDSNSFVIKRLATCYSDNVPANKLLKDRIRSLICISGHLRQRRFGRCLYDFQIMTTRVVGNWVTTVFLSVVCRRLSADKILSVSLPRVIRHGISRARPAPPPRLGPIGEGYRGCTSAALAPDQYQRHVMRRRGGPELAPEPVGRSRRQIERDNPSHHRHPP